MEKDRKSQQATSRKTKAQQILQRNRRKSVNFNECLGRDLVVTITKQIILQIFLGEFLCITGTCRYIKIQNMV
jgi:hypothetical protein